MPKFPDSRQQPLKTDPRSAAPHAHDGRDDDRELLARAAGGDEAAVRKLYRGHLGKLQRHAARILGSTDPDVEDVVQQAFLAALDGAAKFDGRSSVQTWLFGIVTRRALDAARARYRRRRFSRLLSSVGLGNNDQPSPDHAYQAASEVERTLASLSPLQRAVFVLHDIEGYTFAEISGLTDVGISTLHGRLLAARKCIDEEVEQQSRLDDAASREADDAPLPDRPPMNPTRQQRPVRRRNEPGSGERGERAPRGGRDA
ncbi:MAG: RNA polymerase sigma factor [Polyangiales bacterium]